MTLVPSSGNGAAPEPGTVDVARLELVRMRQGIMEAEADFKALQSINVAGASAERLVDLDIRGKKIQALVQERLTRYLEAMDAYVKAGGTDD